MLIVTPDMVRIFRGIDAIRRMGPVFTETVSLAVDVTPGPGFSVVAADDPYHRDAATGLRVGDFVRVCEVPMKVTHLSDPGGNRKQRRRAAAMRRREA